MPLHQPRAQAGVVAPHCSQRIVERLLAVRQRIRDAFVQQARYLLDGLWPEVAADHVAAKRKRQAGPGRPPLTQVDDLLQPFVLVGQLSLVNQQACGDLASSHGILDAVERHDDVVDFGVVEAQGEKRGRERSWNRDLDPLQ